MSNVVNGSPTAAQQPAHPRSDATSIAERIERAAPSGAGLTFLDGSLRPTRIPYRDLAATAVDVARSLRAAGVAPGDRICLLAPTSPSLLATLFGAWRLGAVPVLLPRPRRAEPQKQMAEIRRRVTTARAAVLLTDADHADQAWAPPGGRVLRVTDVAVGAGSGAAPPLPDPGGLGLLQFTSGTTAASRAVPVRQGQITGNIDRLADALGLGRGDRYVTWLPLYHDMGVLTLAGFAAAGLDVIVMATETFTHNPSAWLRAIQDHRGTVTFAPNFAYSLAARTLELRRRRMDLTSLRAAVNGSEPIDADALDRSLAVLGEHGMPAEAMCPGYGLAEATLAVTVGAPTAEPQAVRAAPAHDDAGPMPSRRLMCCGAPLAGTELAIRAPSGEDLPEGQVGEIVVRSPGVMAGYWATPAGEQPAVGHDGRLRTGDLGFLHGGELVVCGRLKDMIIVGGRNLYPEDYEVAAEQIGGIRPGNVVAFSLPDDERMVVVAEARGGTGATGVGLAETLFAHLRGALEYAPQEVLLIRPGTLPKTSSGKRQRGACRRRYLDGTLDVLHTAR